MIPELDLLGHGGDGYRIPHLNVELRVDLHAGRPLHSYLPYHNCMNETMYVCTYVYMYVLHNVCMYMYA